MRPIDRIKSQRIDGSAVLEGDPHGKGGFTVNGKRVDFDWTTEGGLGKWVNVLDSTSYDRRDDVLDVKAKFGMWDPNDKKTTVIKKLEISAGRHDIRIDSIKCEDNSKEKIKVTVDGTELKDGEHRISNDTTIDINDGHVTVRTDSGQEFTAELKQGGHGSYFDMGVDFCNYTNKGQVGGLLGDAINGRLPEINDKVDVTPYILGDRLGHNRREDYNPYAQERRRVGQR
jgi:hypothetical protein